MNGWHNFKLKESTEISEDIYKNIFDEIHKNVNLDIQKIKPKQMKSIVRNLVIISIMNIYHI